MRLTRIIELLPPPPPQISENTKIQRSRKTEYTTNTHFLVLDRILCTYYFECVVDQYLVCGHLLHTPAGPDLMQPAVNLYIKGKHLTS